jgi:hypothetical protein
MKGWTIRMQSGKRLAIGVSTDKARSTGTREARKAEVKHEAHARASLIRLAG